MSSDGMKMKYQAILEDFLREREWTDELEVDHENATVQLFTGVNIETMKGHLAIDVQEKLDYVDVYFYYGLSCPESKFDEMCKLLVGIHNRWAFGRFEMLPDGTLRWRHRMDFEGSQPTWKSIDAVVTPGWNAAERFAGPIAAVALTKQSAEAALAEHDASLQQDDDEGPSEL